MIKKNVRFISLVLVFGFHTFCYAGTVAKAGVFTSKMPPINYAKYYPNGNTSLPPKAVLHNATGLNAARNVTSEQAEERNRKLAADHNVQTPNIDTSRLQTHSNVAAKVIRVNN